MYLRPRYSPKRVLDELRRRLKCHIGVHALDVRLATCLLPSYAVEAFDLTVMSPGYLCTAFASDLGAVGVSGPLSYVVSPQWQVRALTFARG
jgi:hypothetical protein